jgi:iron complex transport system ATP-binding protein
VDHPWKKKSQNLILMQEVSTINNALVSAAHLGIGYAQKKNVQFLHRDLNLNLYEGDMVCLIGPNGCGKSTLIRTLAGIQKPLEGGIDILGKNITSVSNAVRSQLLSIVLTDKTVVDQITVEEITALGRYNSTNWLGSLASADREKIHLALDAVKMSKLSNKTYNTLSDGEKQRAFIAKALASDAPVMLLDEPTAHLDIANRVEILTLLRQLSREKGHAVLLSTHEMDLALQLADEIWLMMPEGSMLKGTPEEVIHSGLLDKVFGNETIYFNPEPGTFAIRRKILNSIDLAGEGENYHITQLALNRLGFSTEIKNSPLARIVVEENQWKLYFEHQEYAGLNLSQTCRLLKRLNNESNQQ